MPVISKKERKQNLTKTHQVADILYTDRMRQNLRLYFTYNGNSVRNLGTSFVAAKNTFTSTNVSLGRGRPPVRYPSDSWYMSGNQSSITSDESVGKKIFVHGFQGGQNLDNSVGGGSCLIMGWIRPEVFDADGESTGSGILSQKDFFDVFLTETGQLGFRIYACNDIDNYFRVQTASPIGEVTAPEYVSVSRSGDGELSYSGTRVEGVSHWHHFMIYLHWPVIDTSPTDEYAYSDFEQSHIWVDGVLQNDLSFQKSAAAALLSGIQSSTSGLEKIRVGFSKGGDTAGDTPDDANFRGSMTDISFSRDDAITTLMTDRGPDAFSKLFYRGAVFGVRTMGSGVTSHSPRLQLVDSENSTQIPTNLSGLDSRRLGNTPSAFDDTKSSERSPNSRLHFPTLLMEEDPLLQHIYSGSYQDGQLYTDVSIFPSGSKLIGTDNPYPGREGNVTATDAARVFLPGHGLRVFDPIVISDHTGTTITDGRYLVKAVLGSDEFVIMDTAGNDVSTAAEGAHTFINITLPVMLDSNLDIQKSYPNYQVDVHPTLDAFDESRHYAPIHNYIVERKYITPSRVTNPEINRVRSPSLGARQDSSVILEKRSKYDRSRGRYPGAPSREKYEKLAQIKTSDDPISRRQRDPKYRTRDRSRRRGFQNQESYETKLVHIVTGSSFFMSGTSDLSDRGFDRPLNEKVCLKMVLPVNDAFNLGNTKTIVDKLYSGVEFGNPLMSYYNFSEKSFQGTHVGMSNPANYIDSPMNEGMDNAAQGMWWNIKSGSLGWLPPPVVILTSSNPYPGHFDQERYYSAIGPGTGSGTTHGTTGFHYGDSPDADATNPLWGWVAGVKKFPQGFYQTLNQPVDTFGFPDSERYAATGSLLLDMSDHIQQPFLLEKIQIKLKWQATTENIDGGISEHRINGNTFQYHLSQAGKTDVHPDVSTAQPYLGVGRGTSIVCFLMNQTAGHTKDPPNAHWLVEAPMSGSGPSNSTYFSSSLHSDTKRDLITWGQHFVYSASTGDLGIDYDDQITYPATTAFRSIEWPYDIVTELKGDDEFNSMVGKEFESVFELTPKNIVPTTFQGSIFSPASGYYLSDDGASLEIASPLEDANGWDSSLICRWRGGPKNILDLNNGRSFSSGIAGRKNNVPIMKYPIHPGLHTGDLREGIQINVSEIGADPTSTYVLQPTDKLIFGMQMVPGLRTISPAVLRQSYHTIPSQNIEIRMYGQYIQQGRAKNVSLNQTPQFTRIVNRDIGEEVHDQWDVAPLTHFTASYVDDIVYNDASTSLYADERYPVFSSTPSPVRNALTCPFMRITPGSDQSDDDKNWKSIYWQLTIPYYTDAAQTKIGYKTRNFYCIASGSESDVEGAFNGTFTDQGEGYGITGQVVRFFEDPDGDPVTETNSTFDKYQSLQTDFIMICTQGLYDGTTSDLEFAATLKHALEHENAFGDDVRVFVDPQTKGVTIRGTVPDGRYETIRTPGNLDHGGDKDANDRPMFTQWIRPPTRQTFNEEEAIYQKYDVYRSTVSGSHYSGRNQFQRSVRRRASTGTAADQGSIRRTIRHAMEGVFDYDSIPPPIEDLLRINFMTYYKEYQTRYSELHAASNEAIQVFGPSSSHIVQEEDTYRDGNNGFHYLFLGDGFKDMGAGTDKATQGAAKYSHNVVADAHWSFSFPFEQRFRDAGIQKSFSPFPREKKMAVFFTASNHNLQREYIQGHQHGSGSWPHTFPTNFWYAHTVEPDGGTTDWGLESDDYNSGPSVRQHQQPRQVVTPAGRTQWLEGSSLRVTSDPGSMNMKDLGDALCRAFYGIGNGARGKHSFLHQDGTSNLWDHFGGGDRQLLTGYRYILTLDGPRGYKYGLSNWAPTAPTLVFKRDSFGQFRDMLEQRLDTLTVDADMTVIDEPVVSARSVSLEEPDLAVDPTQTTRLNKDDHYRVWFPFLDQVDETYETVAPGTGEVKISATETLTFDRYTSPAEGLQRIRSRDRQKQGTKVNVAREIREKANYTIGRGQKYNK